MGANRSIFYDNCGDFYFVGNRSVPIHAKVGTSDDMVQYLKGNPSGIFPQRYDEDQHSISVESVAGSSYFVLQEDKDEVEEKEGMPPGLYRFGYGPDFNIVANPVRDSFTNDYIELSDDASELIEDMNKFYNKKELFDNKGMTAKRGALLFGPPGNGKTMTIMKSVEDLINQEDVVAFALQPDTLSDFGELDQFKQALKGRDVVFILEEITEFGEGDSLLSFLDGEFSWNNSFLIATTNYPERLDPNLIKRPGRFDKTIKVSNPNHEQRKTFLEELSDQTVTTQAVNESDGLSIAYLKEAVVRSEFYELDLVDAIKDIKEQRENIIEEIE